MVCSSLYDPSRKQEKKIAGGVASPASNKTKMELHGHRRFPNDILAATFSALQKILHKKAIFLFSSQIMDLGRESLTGKHPRNAFDEIFSAFFLETLWYEQGGN